MRNLLLIISFLIIYIQLPLSAQTDFSASVEEGCDSLVVKFQYSTTLTVDSVRWNFGDDKESTENSPQHTYSDIGSYTVTLKINNNTPISKSDFIKVGQTPVSDFVIRDTLDFNLFTKTFTANSQEYSPFPYSYSWKISGGVTGNTSYLVHKFDTIGNYNAQLIIVDALGCADTSFHTFEVSKKLNVPNVFTPNEDGFNDLLIIKGDGTTTYNIQIFSRAGLKVFEQSAKILVWDGRMLSGEEVRDGVFYYVITSNDGPALKQTGFLYIYR